MAFKLPKIDFTNAKTRVMVIFTAVVSVIAFLYILLHTTTNNMNNSSTNLANAPSTLQSIPGSSLTPDYYRALVSANNQAAAQAKISGDSAIPTLLNNSNLPGTNTAAVVSNNNDKNCTIICPTPDNVKVADRIDSLIKDGSIAAADGQILLDLGKKKVPVSLYSAVLNNLVKQGKLSPENARKILHDYTQEHTNNLKNATGAVLDKMIQAGDLPLDAANELLNAIGTDDNGSAYAHTLETLVASGQIPLSKAQQLLAHNTEQLATNNANETMGQLEEMASVGKITPAVAHELADYQQRQVPLTEYSEELQHLVSQGRLTPSQAQLLMAQYKQVLAPDVAKKLAAYQAKNLPIASYAGELQQLVNAGKITPAQKQQLLAQYSSLQAAIRPKAIDSMVSQARQAYSDNIKAAVAQHLVTPAAGKSILQLQKNNPDLPTYQAALQQLVTQHQIQPSVAKKLLEQYSNLHNLNNEAQALNDLQDNAATVANYTAELQKAVTEGTINPEQAVKLLDTYKTYKNQTITKPDNSAILEKVAGGKEFAALQSQVQTNQNNLSDSNAIFSRERASGFNFGNKKLQNTANSNMQNIMDAMSTQATQLIASWQPPTMSGQLTADSLEQAGGKNDKNSNKQAAQMQPPLIKAGTILYAVLDTEVNSDYADSPILATIVQGKLKGAKLLGQLNITTKGLDRVALKFTLMNRDDWPSGKAINAVAIDADTAKTALASSVNYHYLLRYGNFFAASFIQGYANAVSNSGSTTTVGGIIGGNTVTHPDYTPREKLMLGFGQIGQNLSSTLSSYLNTPPTVKINSGVSIGILFTQNVTQ